MLTKPGAGIWRTGGAFGSPIHTLFRARTADTQSHPASGMPTDTAGKPPPWRSRSETDEASWGTAVGPPSYTTYWGLLKQPDNQKFSRCLPQRNPPPDLACLIGTSLTDAGLCEIIRLRRREAQHEIPNRNMGGCWLSRCEWLVGLFPHCKQGPSNITAGVHSCSANLSHRDCRLASPGEYLFGSRGKHRHIRPGGSTLGNPAAATNHSS